MKANELRIGNLVYVSDNLTNLIFQEITPINIHNLMHLTGWDKSPVDIEFEPIPLTEEWLLKFGFENGFKQYELQNFGLKVIKDTHSETQFICFQGFINTFNEITNIQYVHQLQNLYFALNNEELTIK